MKLNRLESFLLAAFTAVANWVVFYLLAKHFNSVMRIEMATMLIGGLVIHEIGHAIAMEYNGIRAHLIFLVILGGASPDKRDIKCYEKLHYQNKSCIYFAGVIGNLIAIIIGFVLYYLGIISFNLAMMNVNLNAVLIFYNIFPLWITDGGRWAKLFFDSTPEDLDFGWIFKIGIPIAMAAMFITILTPEIFLFTGPIMLWSLHFQATHDDPEGSYSPLALSPDQRKYWAIFYLIIFVLSMILLGISPKWMA